MAETFQLSVVYKAEDRAFLAALKRELQQAQKLDKVLTHLRQNQRSLATGGGTSGVSRLVRDYDKLTASIRRAEREAARLNRTSSGGTRISATRAPGTVGGAMGATGPLAYLGRAALPIGVGYGAMRLGRAAIGQLAQEDQQLAYFRSLPGANEETARRAMRLGNQYAINRLDLAKGAYQAASSEVPLEFVDQFTKRSAILKTADPNASFEDVVKFSTDVMNAYKPTGILGYNDKDMKRFTDMVVRATQLGKLEIAPMAQNYGEAFQMGAMLHVAPEEILAMGTLMSNTGVQTPEQATAIKQLFNQILSPSDKAQEKAASMGIDFSGKTLKEKGLGALLGQIAEAAHNSSDDLTALAELFPEVRSLKGMLAGYYQDPEKFKMLTGEYRDAENHDVANKASQIASDNLVADWQKFKNTAGELNSILANQTKLYDALGGALAGATASLEGFGQFMSGWDALWGKEVPQALVDLGVIPGETTDQRNERQRVEKYAKDHGISTYDAKTRLTDTELVAFDAARAREQNHAPSVHTTIADPANRDLLTTIAPDPIGPTRADIPAGALEGAALRQNDAAGKLDGAAAALTRAALTLGAITLTTSIFGPVQQTARGTSGIARIGRAIGRAFN